MRKQFRLTAIAASVLLASGCHMAFAAGRQMSDAQLKAMIETIVNQRTADLKKQVTGLQHQVVSLRRELATGSNVRGREYSVRRGYIKRGYYAPGAAGSVGHRASEGSGNYYQDHIPIPGSAARESAKESPLTPIFVAGTPVVSSPYIGLRSAYDGSDLIVNESSVNLDARLLKQSQAMRNMLIKQGIPLPQHPVIELSGVLEGQGTVIKRYPGNTQADIDLTQAALDTFIQVTPCVQGFMSFDYDNSRTVPTRVANSNIFLDKGFVTIGDLNHSPFYMTFGQLYEPFGQYSSYLISDSLAKTLGRTKGRTVIFGMQPQSVSGDGVYAAVYTFKSDTRFADKSVAGGFNLGDKFNIGALNVDLAAGAISTIADSLGAQGTGASNDSLGVHSGFPDPILFRGFGTNRDTEILEHSVPGANLHGVLSYKSFTLIGTYIGATRSFAKQNLSFNNHGAKPNATHIEGVYSFKIHDKPGSLALGYDWTKDALGLNLPQQRYDATINYAFFRDTLESLEFRHDRMYSKKDFAGGGNIPQTFSASHRYVNEITAQMDIYF